MKFVTFFLLFVFTLSSTLKHNVATISNELKDVNKILADLS